MYRHLISSIRPCAITPVARPRLLNITPTILSRFGSGRPDRSEFESRALELLKGYEKIDPAKVIASTFNFGFN